MLILSGTISSIRDTLAHSSNITSTSVILHYVSREVCGKQEQIFCFVVIFDVHRRLYRRFQHARLRGAILAEIPGMETLDLSGRQEAKRLVVAEAIGGGSSITENLTAKPLKI